MNTLYYTKADNKLFWISDLKVNSEAHSQIAEAVEHFITIGCIDAPAVIKIAKLAPTSRFGEVQYFYTDNPKVVPGRAYVVEEFMMGEWLASGKLY